MAAPGRRLVLIDRDGVINRDSSAYIKTPEEWTALPGSLDAIAAMTRAGFAVVVITNQSGIGRGLLTAADLGAIHAKMSREVESAGGRLTAIYHCPHRPDEGCDCRKPAPGLLLRASADLGIALDGVAFLGDKASDLYAARAAGAEPVLVGPNAALARSEGVPHYTTLAAAAAALIDAVGAS